MFSYFQQSVPERQYIPDSVYTVCGEKTQDCDNICSNRVWSRQLNSYVHDTLAGKVFCPFGRGGSMNKPIYGDQAYIYSLIQEPAKFTSTTWGRAPQLDPRPLAKIGLEWRTS
jgi:hypothetical protein